MIRLQSISQRHIERVVFDQVSLHIRPGERLGLTGPNGSGKSTLLRIVMGDEEPEKGAIWINPNARVGYLAQEFSPVSLEGNALAETMSVSRHDARDQLRREELEQLLETVPPGEEQDALLHEYAELIEKHHEAVDPVGEYEAKQILFGLGFNEENIEQPLNQLSGGYQMRVALARLLVRPPQVLLLDEPTNHLDLQSVIWLRKRLKQYDGTLLLISHDRALLNELVTGILDIEHSKIVRYDGNYDAYVEQRALHREHLDAQARNEDRRRKELERFIERFRAKATKARQAQSRVRRLKRMEAEAVRVRPDSKRALQFNLPQPSRGGKEALILENLGKSYDDRTIYQGVNLTLYRGQRICIVGRNGAGKSTLLRIMAGVLPFESGSRRLGHDITMAYYSQQRMDMLNADNTLLDELRTVSRPDQGEEYLRSLLGLFLFHGDDHFKRCSVLSGGEKSRLALAKILLDPPNLLLMDEPTTHLDVSSREALEAALDPFTGTLCFITHDETFVRNLADNILETENGRLTLYPGGYDYYLDKKEELGEEAPQLTLNPPPVQPEKSNPPQREEKKDDKPQLSKEERRKMRVRFNELEREIEQAESGRDAAMIRLQDPAVYADHVKLTETQAEIERLKTEIDTLAEEWAELGEQLEL